MVNSARPSPHLFGRDVVAFPPGSSFPNDSIRFDLIGMKLNHSENLFLTTIVVEWSRHAGRQRDGKDVNPKGFESG